jgi:hypothetical protein
LQAIQSFEPEGLKTKFAAGIENCFPNGFGILAAD